MPALPEGAGEPLRPDAGQVPPPTATPGAWTDYPPARPPGPGYPSPYGPGGWTDYPPGPAYVPPGWGGGQQPAPPGGPGRGPGTAARRGGALSGVAAALIALVKYGLYFGKFGFTAITMLVAVAAYSLIFGWTFAAGLVLLIFVHEMGHFLTSRAMGVPMSAPVFIPFLGAFTSAGRGLTRDRRVEAVIAIAGPVAGFAASLALYLWGLAQGAPTQGVGFALSLSWFGFFLTLFNLIPMLPLDGGRVASSISKWFNLAGLVIIAALLVTEYVSGPAANPILILIFLVGAYSVWGRFRAGRMGTEAPPLPAATRVLIGTGYVALVALSGLFMSLSVGWLNAHGLVQVT